MAQNMIFFFFGECSLCVRLYSLLDRVFCLMSIRSSQLTVLVICILNDFLTTVLPSTERKYVEFSEHNSGFPSLQFCQFWLHNI